MRRRPDCVKARREPRASCDSGSFGSWPRRSSLSLCARKPLVERPRGVGDRLQRVGQVVDAELSARRRRSRSTVSTESYQAGAQTPSVARRPGAQDSIARVEGNRRTPRRAPSACRADRRARPGPRSPAGARPSRSAARSKSSACAGRPISSSVKSSRFMRVGRQHGLGRADQERVDEVVRPLAAECRQHVVRHVLLVPDRLAIRRRSDERVGDLAPVGRLRGDHLFAHRDG